MDISRIAGNIDLNSGDNFLLLYGAVDDVFCDKDLMIMNIDQVLWRYFHERGYQRIVFYDGTRKMYWLDSESRQLCRDVDKKEKSSSGKNTEKKNIFKGPLGAPKQTASTKVEPQKEEKRPKSSIVDSPTMSDLSALDIFNKILDSDNSDISTVIIFTHANDINERNFEGKSFRDFQNRLVNWAKTVSIKPNLCVFSFQGGHSRQDLLNICQLNQLTALTNILNQRDGDNSSNIIRISEPDKKELLNLIHRQRLVDGLEVDWKHLEKLAQWASADHKHLRFWRAKLSTIQELTRESVSPLLSTDNGISDKPALERLHALIGLEKVKRHIQELLYMSQDQLEAKVEYNFGSLHMAFLGNPGTGKTEVANLVGEIFQEAGLLFRGHTVIAENRSALIAEHEGGSAIKTNSMIDQAIGGILFIDEAHELIRDDNDPFGKEALRTLVARMERERNNFCVIFAGYTQDIKRMIAHDQGLKSRIKTLIDFEDYTPEELLKIFELMVSRQTEKGAPEFEKEALTTVGRVIEGMYETRNPEDWGNAREIRNLLEKMTACAISRRMDIMRNNKNAEVARTTTSEDIPDEHKVFLDGEIDVDTLLVELNSLVGLAPIKDLVRHLIDQEFHKNKMIAQGGTPPAEKPMLHMLFKGNPGTGKTIVATLMGRIFRGLGLLPKGQVVTVTGGELVGSHVGAAQDKAKEKIREAMGGILFIDEIYGLAEGSLGDTYGVDVITNALLPAMENHKDRLVIIGAGYSKKIENFLTNNEGLSSRFANHVDFPDFTDDELFEILSQYTQKQGYLLSPESEEVLKQAFVGIVADKSEDFGNARTVKQEYFPSMMVKLTERLRGVDGSLEILQTILPEDIPEQILNYVNNISSDDLNIGDILRPFNSLIGLKSVKSMVRTHCNRLQVEKLRGNEMSLAPGHYIFIGNPGTGKTTVARKMGEMFRALGLLKKGHLVEVGRVDLVAGYQGQSAIKTKEVLEKSLDGVLFIDEAYQLIEGEHDAFGKEALEALVAFMENNANRLSIIAAGYPAPMSKFIEANPGLPSRFVGKIVFENYNAKEMLEIFKLQASERKMILGDDLEATLLDIFSVWEERADSTFGNGREVKNLLETMCGSQGNRLVAQLDGKEPSNKSVLYTLEREDLPEDIE